MKVSLRLLMKESYVEGRKRPSMGPHAGRQFDMPDLDSYSCQVAKIIKGCHQLSIFY